MFRDTSMDYLSRDEVLEIWNNNMRLTDEQLLAMDETEFRARVRERSHHTLEIQLYATAYRTGCSCGRIRGGRADVPRRGILRQTAEEIQSAGLYPAGDLCGCRIW